jgi:hypothetical protein
MIKKDLFKIIDYISADCTITVIYKFNKILIL